MPSPTSPPGQTTLRRTFVDICRGYSIGHHRDKPFYIRHLSHFEHLRYDDLQARFEEQAKAAGAYTEAAQMERLRSKGLWSDAKDRDIARQRDTIIRFEEAAKSVTLPSMQENYARQIKDERGKLEAMLNERAQLLGRTAELHAQLLLNDHYILTNIFGDQGLTSPLFTETTFEDLADSEVEALLSAYHGSIDPCDDRHLRYLAVQDFFTSYYTLCQDRLDAFFGKPVSQLTYYQVRLGNISRYFKTLIEQTDLSKLDPKVRTDPEAIERLYTSQKNMGKMADEGKVPANMTAQDIDQLGVKKQLTNVTEELSATEMVQRYMKRSG
jgi:hypothetical protein